ncbi:hypothetical protein BcDW1_2167 [Botrytis cinerea BcDW1]|uniref:Secreted protein CSS2 C-terminal domain-containing protein n=1 Tax=Botryotinia fuckeliana (strain BcDW1) TaxID=1290391 RepID=M7UYZ9_BOTF1|nr:hypothetical protein BcDW1_2167 [Botrytis cinerea BcDW1]
MRFAISLSLIAMSCITPIYSFAIEFPSAIVNSLGTWAATVTSSIKVLSNQGSCTTSSGSLDGISWVYHASGRNCVTKSEAYLIQRAIKHHLETDDGGLCATECLDLTDSGAWNGYLLAGPTSNFDSSMYCGPTISFETCTSGGKNDL